jgi:peptidyl-prolyl cis-trans isomerase B (cyclophilin B)
VASKSRQRESREARERLKRYEARQEVHARQTRRRVRDNIIAVAGVVAVAALAGVTQVVYFTAGPGAPTPRPSITAEAGENVGAPAADLAEYRTWTGVLTINGIALGIELDGANAPQAASGVIQDLNAGYYPGKTCHRLARNEGFGILQCGSFDGVGGGDAGFSYGPIENAPLDGIYPAGTIAMARASNDGYSMGHQFFICFEDTALPADTAGGYTVVGKVTSGLDQLIAQVVDGGIVPGSSETDGSPVVPTTISALTLQ